MKHAPRARTVGGAATRSPNGSGKTVKLHTSTTNEMANVAAHIETKATCDARSFSLGTPSPICTSSPAPINTMRAHDRTNTNQFRDIPASGGGSGTASTSKLMQRHGSGVIRQTSTNRAVLRLSE
ncbi:hypothetical protein ON010_g12302 [Phytophthora cinnamomi]|nr:hypothetical protein ON010_g12302 [Phytophthora cinnamomi]